MQVCDLLLASGLSVRDSLLPQLLQFPQFESEEIRLVNQLAQQDVKAASREVLEACVLHRSTGGFMAHRTAHPVTRCTRMLSRSAIQRQAEKDEKGFRFRMRDASFSAYLLTIPSRGKTASSAYCLLAVDCCCASVMHIKDGCRAVAEICSDAWASTWMTTDVRHATKFAPLGYRARLSNIALDKMN